MWMPDHPTTSQPTRVRAGAEPFTGIRASVGYAEASRISYRIRPASAIDRGVVVPNGIALKEGVT
jgi:hypothetical protein